MVGNGVANAADKEVIPAPKKKLNSKQIKRQIDYRQSYFTILGTHFYGVIKPMAVTKKVPFNMDVLKKSVDSINALSKIELIDHGFGRNSILKKKTKAKPLIWREWKRFSGLYLALVDKIENLKLATDRDKRFLVEEYATELDQACKNCHQRYLAK